MPFPLIPLLGLGAGIAGGIASRRQSRKNVTDQITADKELAEYAYGKDLEMWKRQNEYNLPTSQMSRLRDAGLNPHLVYGSGTVTGNTSGQMPKYQSVRTDFSKRQAVLPAIEQLGQFQNFQMRQAQIDTTEAERDIAQLRRNLLIGKVPETITGPTGKTKVEMSPYMSQLFKTQLEVQRATVNRILQDTRRTSVLGDIQEIRRDFERWMQSFGVAGKGVNILKTLFGK